MAGIPSVTDDIVNNRLLTYFRGLSYRYTLLGFRLTIVLPMIALFTYGLIVCFGIRPYYRAPNYGSPPLGLQSEWIATALIPWVFLLSSKRNLIAALTGLSLESLQSLHKLVSWNCLFFALVHTIAMINQALKQAPWSCKLTLNYVCRC